MWKRQQTSRGRVITVHFSECDMDVSTSSGQFHTAPAPATQMELCLESEQSFGRGLPWWEPINQDPAECEPVMHTLIAAVQKIYGRYKCQQVADHYTGFTGRRSGSVRFSQREHDRTEGSDQMMRWWRCEESDSLKIQKRFFHRSTTTKPPKMYVL